MYDPLTEMYNSYGRMDEDEKNGWSKEAARVWVTDQRMYETSRGFEPHDFDAEYVYETIMEFIQQDADDTE